MSNKYLKLSNGNYLKLAGSTSETWVINESPSGFPSTKATITYNANFISNNTSFASIGLCYAGRAAPSKSIYFDTKTVYTFEGSWEDEAYRTVTFETAPTGDLLTWLQANAIKQESEASKYLYTNE